MRPWNSILHRAGFYQIRARETRKGPLSALEQRLGDSGTQNATKLPLHLKREVERHLEAVTLVRGM